MATDGKLHIYRKYRPIQPSDQEHMVRELVKSGMPFEQANTLVRTLDDRDQFQKADYREAFLSIERWAQRTDFSTALPFIVVASDGSGDYTSIKDAVDATASGTTKPTNIYVKPTALTYTDTSAVAVGGKNVFIFSFGPDTHSNGSRVEWNFQGFDYSSNCVVSIYGIDLTQNGTAHDFCNPTSSARLDLSLEHVDATSWTSGSASFMPTSAAQPQGTWSLIDARLPRPRTGTGTVAISIDALRSSFSVTASTTLTFSGQFQRYVDCEIEATGANANWTLTGVTQVFVGTTFSSAADGFDPNITLKPTPVTGTKQSRVTFSSCASYSSNPGNLTVDLSAGLLSSTTVMGAVVSGGHFSNWQLTTIGPAGGTNHVVAEVYLSGLWTKVTIGTTSTRADLQLQGTQNPALTISSDTCAVYASGQGFATGKSFDITGLINILDFAGDSTYAATGTDTGGTSTVRIT